MGKESLNPAQPVVRMKARLSLCGRPRIHSSAMAGICTSLQKPALATSLLTFCTVWTLTGGGSGCGLVSLSLSRCRRRWRGRGSGGDRSTWACGAPLSMPPSPPGAQLPVSCQVGTIFLQVGLCERVSRPPEPSSPMLGPREPGTGRPPRPHRLQPRGAVPRASPRGASEERGSAAAPSGLLADR